MWIFQIAQNLSISSSVKILLSGGAKVENIFWVVAGQTTLGTASVLNGTVLDQTAIVLNAGARLNGRALAQTAVTLDSNIVSAPMNASVLVVPSYVPQPVLMAQNISAPTVVTPVSVVTTGTPAFQQMRAVARSYWKGVRHNDVKILQEYLISQNKGPAAQALAKVNPTTYFGNLTKAALSEFQGSVGISPSSGNFGPITRAYISTH